MSALSLFGLFAVTAMLVFYALEHRNPSFILAFAGACVLGSIYGFLQGAWPFGLVEAVWAGVAARRWWVGHKPRNAYLKASIASRASLSDELAECDHLAAEGLDESEAPPLD